jgi:hypothetical protein
MTMRGEIEGDVKYAVWLWQAAPKGSCFQFVSALGYFKSVLKNDATDRP